MPPSHQHRPSHSSAFARPSMLASGPAAQSSSLAASSGSSMSAAKARQYTHLHAQLAQLNAHLADTENLLRMTAVQAGDMRFLGGYVGGLFMGAAKVLGEEGVKEEGAKEKEGGVKEESE
ncbi:hypothetical protein ASPZODRAFT_19781 [Penicilliopsis zonata CBS 506.65]|uniref:DASH complex subunit Hsk3 like-domain-containing protein n=1 Tax=Penicilliopsis zonata CBS 506.65 TaxID=1073090 RepID=A0A1L9S7E5_9EURO|nr:hypothetical protein ASPZODRAFT_19781 [Penicilliopsis zonata CBS 506.65]OJJ43085.1 hypothetical protein ASPZODRAFT_19781 [Penicilliopsis zonata CBS 506.65]